MIGKQAFASMNCLELFPRGSFVLLFLGGFLYCCLFMDWLVCFTWEILRNLNEMLVAHSTYFHTQWPFKIVATCLFYGKQHGILLANILKSHLQGKAKYSAYTRSTEVVSCFVFKPTNLQSSFVLADKNVLTRGSSKKKNSISARIKGKNSSHEHILW